jgi:hypothetical protein
MQRHPASRIRHSSLVARRFPFCILHSAFCIAAVAAFAATASAVDFTLTVASADATKGSVSAVDGTYPDGTAVTVTATPEAGWTFTRWDGVVPSLRLDNPLVLPVTNDTAVTAVFGRTHYVATTGSNSTADGTNPATPYLTIEAAYAAAADGDTISVGAGTFAGSADTTFSKAVVIRGAGMALTTRSGKRTTLDNANLIFADMRFTGYGSGGAVTFTANGGTLLRGDVSKNTRTSTDGTGVACASGNLVGCVITNNTNGNGGNGVGIKVTGGPTLLEDCLIADNSTGYAGSCGGLAIVYGTHDSAPYSKPTILRHCTIVRNKGGEGKGCGGLNIGDQRFRLVIEGCLIGGNTKFTDETADGMDDVRLLGNNTTILRTVRDTVIARMCVPTNPTRWTFENCVTNVPAGFTDIRGGDFTVTRRSPAWGLCADGSDAGCFQSPRDGSFDVGCYALTNSVCGRLETVLVAKAENVPGATVAFEWDLDGDGVFEASGETVPALYDEPGLHGVTVRATSGGESVTRTLANLIYVAPREIFAWPDSPSPAFPYATWETAAHTVNAAVDAAEDGCKVQLTNAFYQVSASVRVCRDIELCGTGPENNSVKGAAGSIGNYNSIDANATGTCVQYTGGDVVPIRIYRSGVLLHDMAIGPGRPNVVGLYENAIVSNCVIRSGQYTSGTGVGAVMRGGLITHCVISNNYTSGGGNGGSVNLAVSGATLRNCLVVGAIHTATSTSSPCKGTVYAVAGTVVENCTIVGNTATLGAGIYTTGAAIIRNNIVRGNTAKADSSGHADWYDATDTGIYSNNCMEVAHGENAETRPPAFIYESGRNTYTFAAGSPCANTGVALPWMTATATDFFGNPRLQGEAPDIGCFEADMSQTTCDVSADPATAFGATNVALSAVIVGGSLSGDVAYLWDFDGDGTTDATGPVVTNRFEEGRHSVTLTVTVDGETRFTVPKEDVVTIYPRVIYVATSCAGSAFPYNTPETAATSINDAIDVAMDGAEIIVGAGTHLASRQILINRAVTLRAADGLPARPRILRGDNSGSVYFTVGSPGALVEGLVIDNASKNLRALEITASGGTIRDCVVSNAHYTSGSGVGLSAAAGLFDRGVIVNTDASGGASGGAAGLAAYLSGSAVMRNSLIYKNATNKGESKLGVIYVTGNARMENCTVVSNTCGAYPAVYVAKTTAGGSAAVVNNIAWGNYFRVTPSAAYQGGADWFVDTTASGFAWSNNCTAVAYQAGDRTVTEDPRFRAPANFDYALGKGTPCRNKGVRLDWMDGALDLNGNPRIFGTRPDIGAIEFTGRDGTTIMLR